MALVPIIDQDPLAAEERADPIVAMALFLSRQFGMIISTAQVERLFHDHWKKLSPLAHAIHAKTELKGG